MKLRERFFVEPGHMSRADLFSEPTLLTTLESTKEDRKFGLERLWYLRAQIVVGFWANKSNLADATAIARRQVMHMIYADVLLELSMLEKSISDGDKAACYAVINRIRSAVVEGV